jgi:choline-glycine betaine transporter
LVSHADLYDRCSFAETVPPPLTKFLLSVLVNTAGICTSLGLGAFQIVAGLQRLGWVDPDQSEEQETRTLAIIVWFITIIATISVISGLDVGIKYLSMFGFGLGLLLMFFVLALERTNYILNLTVQSIGYYFQWSIFQLNFWTDAFAQLPEGEGRAVDGQESPAWFMDAW